MTSIVVFAKEPEPGKVKTRFIGDITGEDAAMLYRAFVRDTIALVERSERGQPVLAYSCAGEPTWLRSVAGPSWMLTDQGGGGLGDRLHRVTTRFVSEGPVIVIGSDSPTLPPEYLRSAVEALSHCEVTIGPSEDGGYYLIGLRRPSPELFLSRERLGGDWNEIAWSTSRVFGQTVARLERHEIRWQRLPTWYDLDDADALRRWYTSHDAPGDAPHTRTVVTRLADKLGIRSEEA